MMSPISSRIMSEAITAKQYLVHMIDTGIRFMCRDDEFVLGAMQRAACGPVHYGCFGGGCGICKMKIVSGEYYAGKKMSAAHITPEEREEGKALICCIKPRSDMKISQIS